MTKVDIQTAIAKAMDARAKKTGITAERVLKEIALMSFVDIRNVFTTAGQLRPIKALEDDVALGIQSIEVVVRPTGKTVEEGNTEVEHVYKIRLVDKCKGLDMLMRHLGAYNQNRKGSQRAVSIVLDYGGRKPPK